MKISNYAIMISLMIKLRTGGGGKDKLEAAIEANTYETSHELPGVKFQ